MMSAMIDTLKTTTRRPLDVVLGRGKEVQAYAGNVRMREIIRQGPRPRFKAAKADGSKATIVDDVLQDIQSGHGIPNHRVRFLKEVLPSSSTKPENSLSSARSKAEQRRAKNRRRQRLRRQRQRRKRGGGDKVAEDLPPRVYIEVDESVARKKVHHALREPKTPKAASPEQLAAIGDAIRRIAGKEMLASATSNRIFQPVVAPAAAENHPQEARHGPTGQGNAKGMVLPDEHHDADAAEKQRSNDPHSPTPPLAPNELAPFSSHQRESHATIVPPSPCKERNKEEDDGTSFFHDQDHHGDAGSDEDARGPLPHRVSYEFDVMRSFDLHGPAEHECDRLWAEQQSAIMMMEDSNNGKAAEDDRNGLAYFASLSSSSNVAATMPPLRDLAVSPIPVHYHDPPSCHDSAADDSALHAAPPLLHDHLLEADHDHDRGMASIADIFCDDTVSHHDVLVDSPASMMIVGSNSAIIMEGEEDAVTNQVCL